MILEGEYALEYEGVSKAFKRKKREIKAVVDLNLKIKKGETFALLGMNGAGKTTAIKMATGLLKADFGTVKIFGSDVSNDENTKRLFNISPQETAIAPMLSVRDNLMFIAEIYGYKKAEAATKCEAIMEKMRLLERAKDVAGKLSGGYKRRLSIAMAMITEPKLLFLDEPTLGVDVVARREMWRLLKSLKHDGVTIVLTTHYLEEAEALCDRIAIMVGGSVAACGTAEELTLSSGEGSFENAFLKISGMGDYINV